MSAVSVAEARAYLGVSDAESDARIQMIVDAAESDIAQDCGPLIPTQVTVTALNSTGSIPLPITPFIGPITLAQNLETGQVYPDPASIIERQPGVVGLPMGGGLLPGSWKLAYLAGWSDLPPALKLAVLELATHLWKTQRSATFRPDQTPPGAAHARPWRVQELLEPFVQQGGFA